MKLDALELLIFNVAALPVPVPDNVKPPNVGVALVCILCGNENVTAPVFALTFTWFVVPDTDVIFASVYVVLIELPFQVPDDIVPEDTVKPFIVPAKVAPAKSKLK